MDRQTVKFYTLPNLTRIGYLVCNYLFIINYYILLSLFSDIAKYGIGFLLGVCITIILGTIIAVAVCCYLRNRNNKQDHETDGVIARSKL